MPRNSARHCLAEGNTMFEVIAWYTEDSKRVIASGLREFDTAINYANSEFARNRDAIVSVLTPNGFVKYEISEFGIQYT